MVDTQTATAGNAALQEQLQKNYSATLGLGIVAIICTGVIFLMQYKILSAIVVGLAVLTKIATK